MLMKLLQPIGEMILEIYVKAVIDHVVKQNFCININQNIQHSSEHIAICLVMVMSVNEPFLSCI